MPTSSYHFLAPAPQLLSPSFGAHGGFGQSPESQGWGGQGATPKSHTGKMQISPQLLPSGVGAGLQVIGQRGEWRDPRPPVISLPGPLWERRANILTLGGLAGGWC